MHKEEQIEVELETKYGYKFLIVTYGDTENFIKYVQYCLKIKKPIIICSLPTKREFIFSCNELKNIKLRTL